MRRNVTRPIIITFAFIAAGALGTSPVPHRHAMAQTPAGDASKRATTVDLDALENNPEKYVGQTVTVEGEVQKVLGPHLFTIDERDWADPEREMPVVVPEPFAAMVRSDVPVRVTGTVQKVPIARIEAARGFLSDPKIRAEIETKPVLVATDVTAMQSGVTLRVRTDTPVGTSGTSASPPVTDTNQVARATDKNLVGQRVNLSGVTVSSAGDEGFWIRTPSGERIFVMTAKKPGVKEGQTANVEGVVLELPEGLRVKVNAAGEPIYIFADRVTPR